MSQTDKDAPQGQTDVDWPAILRTWPPSKVFQYPGPAQPGDAPLEVVMAECDRRRKPPLQDWPLDQLTFMRDVNDSGGGYSNSPYQSELNRRTQDEQTKTLIAISARLEKVTWIIAFLTAVNVLAIVIQLLSLH